MKLLSEVSERSNVPTGLNELEQLLQAFDYKIKLNELFDSVAPAAESNYLSKMDAQIAR